MNPVASAGAPMAAANLDEVRRQYRYWQMRILLATIAGYALFYFVRKNLSVAMPVMEHDLGISKKQLGLFLTLHGSLYGVARFANGILADRVNGRWFMVSGLCLCAAVNVLFGLSSSVLAFGILWMANGWFQGMGFPPCARLMTHWFPPKVLATKMSIWNSSHSIGAGLVVVLCGYLALRDWRLCFHVPAALAMLGAIGLAMALRDTPESMGLPPVEGTHDSRFTAGEPLGRTLRSLVFSNRYIWLLSFANFFVYTVRYGILDWGPTFLKQSRHVELSKAGWMMAAFEASGIVGMLVSGWLTDRVFCGRGARACLVYMLLCMGSLLLFWRLPPGSTALSTVVLCTAGFFIYGPQCLIGIASANLATKRAAAAAAGLTGLFGYLSTIVSGVGVGMLVQQRGWNAGFLMFVVAALLGAILFACCWPAAAHGYGGRS